MKNSLIIGLLMLVVGLGIGYWYGKLNGSANFTDSDIALINLLDDVNKNSKTNGLRNANRLDSAKANVYINSYYKALTSTDDIIQKKFIQTVYNARGGWSIRLDSLENIWKNDKAKDIKYLYFYPAINNDSNELTIITLGAKLRGDKLVLAHGREKIKKSSGSLTNEDEIWDNASPCPSNCPTNPLY